MKGIPALFLLCLLSLKGSCQEFNLTGICKENHPDFFKSQGIQLNYISAGDIFNIVYAECNWNIDPSVNYISGSVAYYLVSEDNYADTLILDLADPMIVSSVIYHGVNVSFDHSDNLLKIFFPQVIAPAVLDSLIIYYEGAPVATGNGSFVQTEHSGVPIIQTLSEPYGARDWWPCKQDHGDKIDSISINVTSPLQYRTASNGKLISEDSTLTQRTCHWKSNYPVAPYLVAIAVTDYAIYTDTVILSNGDTLPVLNYIYPESLNSAIPSLEEIGDIIHFYDSLTITYPFSKEKYGHAQFSWGGGMEHQTMSFIGNFSRELIAHECAHQWFGDDVTCGSWQDIWLHEGFATYFAALFLERYHHEEWVSWLLSNRSFATSMRGGSVYCDDTTSVSRIFNGVLSYRRAASLLHMLRWKLGDESFFTGIKNYLLDNNLKYSFARTADLQYHLEQSGGQPLAQFFTEWFYGEGFPEYNIIWESTHDKLTLEISQKASDNSSSFFHMPLPVLLSDGINDTLVIANPESFNESFVYSPNFKVKNVVFDPDAWILSGFNNVMERSLQEDLIGLYPSIVKNSVTIYSKQPGIKINNFSIFDSVGKKVYERSFPLQELKYFLTIPDFPDGMYFGQIETSGGVVNQKMEIIHD